MKTKYYSYKIGRLAKGCQLCVKGEKSVLFITGLCSKHCFFCPISDQKWNKDVIYINEMPNADFKDVINEIKLCGSKGVGITGGDPLIKIERVVQFIKILKKEFGKNFHIHLYTPLNLVNEKKIRELYKAGLDEIRFHPDLKDKKEWKKIELAKVFNWDIGIEIPVIPGYGVYIKHLVDFIRILNLTPGTKISFINLNELEISDTNANNLVDKGFRAKDDVSYGVKGSEELAFEILNFIRKKKIKIDVHYCTTTLKDRIQLAKRIKKRALNIKKKYDILTKEGMLKRGVIYLSEFYPGFGYNDKLMNLNKGVKNKCIKKLNKIKNELIKKYQIPGDLIDIDKKKIRILTSINLIKKIKIKKIKKAIIIEYPTYDNMIVELEFL